MRLKVRDDRPVARRAPLALAIALVSLTAACSSTGPARVSTMGTPPPGYKVGKPYQIDGVWYYPRADWNYDETGIASWYGDEFHGRPTANGETFDMNQVSAAHKTLQLPVDARVTNLENGRSIVVRINDRGPFVNNRIIDLSRRSAQLLGFERQGTAKVRVQVLSPTGGVPGSSAPVFVAAKPVTPEEERTAAAAAPRGTVEAKSLAPPPGVQQAPATPVRAQPLPPSAPAAAQPSTRTAAVQAQSGARPTPTASAVNTEALQDKVSVVPVKATQIYVQAGAFARYDNANKLKAELSSLGQTSISQTTRDGIAFFRVRIGPVQNVDDADRMLSQILARGQTGARIVVE